MTCVCVCLCVQDAKCPICSWVHSDPLQPPQHLTSATTSLTTTAVSTHFSPQKKTKGIVHYSDRTHELTHTPSLVSSPSHTHALTSLVKQEPEEARDDAKQDTKGTKRKRSCARKESTAAAEKKLKQEEEVKQEEKPGGKKRVKKRGKEEVQAKEVKQEASKGAVKVKTKTKVKEEVKEEVKKEQEDKQNKEAPLSVKRTRPVRAAAKRH